MKAVVNIESISMPPGDYWVGDNCYAVPNERWMEWLEAANYESADRFLLAELSLPDHAPGWGEQFSVAAVHTAYGDGTYFDQEGRGYPVDAGMIGVVPVEIATEEPGWGSHLITFDTSFKLGYEEDEGVIQIGHLRIPTNPRDVECPGGCGYDEDDCHCYDEDEPEGEEDGGW